MLYSKLDDITLLLRILANDNVSLDIICLQETWIPSNDDISLFEIDGYDMLSQPRKHSMHVGLSIYIRNDITYYIMRF